MARSRQAEGRKSWMRVQGETSTDSPCAIFRKQASLFRYVFRTVFDGRRIGALEGGQDSIKLAMLHHIAVVTAGNRKRYADVYGQLRLPKVYLPSIRAINALSGLGAGTYA